MFGDADTGSGDGQGGGGGDVEGTAGIATSATRIDEGITLSTADVESGIFREMKRRRRRTDRLGKPNNLLHGLALHVERYQECRDLRISGLAVEDGEHKFAGLVTRQGAAMVGNLVKSLGDHGESIVTHERDTEQFLLVAEEANEQTISKK
jgi:hypothetical protein